ncbi:EVE domain-containing protein [Luteolibacter sp. AS25]|uniref:EVE domain-containing protein n=1 Tax=Luteolibacter sp. AS25 TaxID=3135776 RepID=UPI00398B8FA0
MPWLIKSEPDAFSIQDLEKVEQEPWSGVRNYQARNFMWREMKVGDLALFYHSNAKPPGIAGVAKVASASYPDPTQFDEKSEYFDPKATEEKPRWYLVDFEHVVTFPEEIPLQALKEDKALTEMLVCQKGSRLSITPVEEKHFQHILKLSGTKP